MAGNKSMGLFQALADKKSMNALPKGGGVGSFKDFLKERGEYPFREEEDGGMGLRSRKIFGMRLETLLAVALAFGITNVISFTLGAWNSGVEASEPARTALRERQPALEKPGPARPQGNLGPRERTVPARRREIPPPRAVRRTPAAPAARPEPAAAPRDVRYTIRTITLKQDQRELATKIKNYFSRKAVPDVVVRSSGSHLVIEVGALSSVRSSKAKSLLKKVRSLPHFRGNSFRSAYFVKK